MIKLVSFWKKQEQQWCFFSLRKLTCFRRFCYGLLCFPINPFWIQLIYFTIISSLGYLFFRLVPGTKTSIDDLDLFFTSVSATTVSSMSTVEMEVFSNTHLIIFIFLMLFGGEVFTSMLGLLFSNNPNLTARIDTDTDTDNIFDVEHREISNLKYKSVKLLGYVVLGYHLTVHILGSCFVYLYISFNNRARNVLKLKKIRQLTFSIFLIVSTLSNCGFVPTNENMMIFKKNSGLLLILIPQVLLGNTLFPPFLRILIWVLKKITKRDELSYMLDHSKEMKYSHLMSRLYVCSLSITVLGFVSIQFILLCSMEWWNVEAMKGLSNGYEKMAAALFQVVNSRHAGESVFDLSVLSPALMVLFVFMMYLPPNFLFMPITKQEKCPNNIIKRKKEKKKIFVGSLIFSQLSYLVIFVILICATEREKMKEDPLNFNVLNICIEVISCERRIESSSFCENKMYGFVGRWSGKGKLILIVVMFFGRLKKFNMKGGRSWKLL